MRLLAAFIVVLTVAALAQPALGSRPANGTLAVTATVGPTCPVVRPGTACDDRPYTGTLRVQGNGRSRRLIVRDGRGRIALPAGRYTLSTTGTLPSLRPVATRVRAGRTTRITVSLDSGIR